MHHEQHNYIDKTLYAEVIHLADSFTTSPAYLCRMKPQVQIMETWRYTESWKRGDTQNLPSV